MIIRSAEEQDRGSILDVERLAFGGDDVADLVRALLDDPSAEPRVSLLAEEDGSVVGHVLLTSGAIGSDDSGAAPVEVAVLAPLAVVPESQRQGVGTALVHAAIEVAGSLGFELMFVLGDPEYYPRHGFMIAAEHGIFAPYPIDPIEAFMVLELWEGALEGVRGTLRPADVFMHPEHWRE